MWAVSHFRKNTLEVNGLEIRKLVAEKQVTVRVTKARHDEARLK